MATLLLLQTRKKVTAAEVAAELEISERTARRDLEALAMAGLPVYPQAGRGGGWMLLGGARTDLSGLTAQEARTLFMVAGPEASATPELKAALRKLVRALPEPFRASAEVAASSVVIDPGGWGYERAAPAKRPRHLDALQAVVASAGQARLGYADRTGQATTRVVHPLGLAMKGTVWYLVADTAAGQRTFRVDRVTSVEPTGDPVERPPGFDMATAWAQIVEHVRELRSPHQVDAVVDAEALHILGWLFQRRMQVVGEADEPGRVTVRIGGPRVEEIAARIAGLGSRVRVIAPAEAVAYLADVGRQLVETYDGPTPRRAARART